MWSKTKNIDNYICEIIDNKKKTEKLWDSKEILGDLKDEVITKGKYSFLKISKKFAEACLFDSLAPGQKTLKVYVNISSPDNKEKFKLITREEYIDIVCDQLEYLREDIVINRITGDPNSDDLIDPAWLVKKFGVLNEIDKELERRNTYQGYRKTILNYVHNLVDSYIKDNDIVVDATIGNGNDTLYLSNVVKNGKVFGFDIQKDALNNTTHLLSNNNCSNYELFLDSHSNMTKYLSEYLGKVSLVLFNLGYLPSGDKTITTNYETTIKGIEESFKLIHKMGMILVVIYPGHEAGKLESIKIHEYLDNNNITYIEYHNTDNEIAPYLIEIKKK